MTLQALVGLQHSTPADALKFAERYDRDRRHVDEHRVIGKVIDAVQYADGALELCAGGAWLAISTNGSEVVHQVGDARSTIANVETDEAIALNFAGHIQEWDRRDVSRVLIGKILTKVFVTPDFLYLCVANVGVVAISALIDADTGASFLYWDFSE